MTGNPPNLPPGMTQEWYERQFALMRELKFLRKRAKRSPEHMNRIMADACSSLPPGMSREFYDYWRLFAEDLALLRDLIDRSQEQFDALKQQYNNPSERKA